MQATAFKNTNLNSRTSRNLATVIYDQIEVGTLRPGERLGTAKELAKKFNVSFGSARQSLEVLAAKGVVFRKPRAGTFVSENLSRTSTVHAASNNHSMFALLVPDLRLAEYAYMTRYIQDEAHKVNLDVIVSSTDNERERYDQTIYRQIKSGVSGMILISPSYERVSLETVLELKNSGIPVVCFAHELEGTGWPTVHTDVFHGTYIATKHLCEIGRKRIAFVSYETTSSDKTYVPKRCGVYKALLEMGRNSGGPLELIVPLKFYSPQLGWSNNPELRHFVGEWLDANKDVDAICCDHDHIATAALRLLQDRGVRVPHDVAITGSGNFEQFFGLTPGELTTVDTRLPEKAAEMLRLLLAIRNGEQIEPDLKVAFRPELIVGGSTVVK
jgi:GntR family transcriptional regulator, arabinose operon transcriptional repressor